MTERSKFLPPLLAAATLLFASAGATTIAAEQAHALKCSPVCLPAPEEGGEEELPPPPPPKPTPPPTRSMLVIGVGWTHPVSESSSELKPGRSGEYVSYLNGHVNEFFSQQAAPAPFVRWQATNAGEFMISPPKGIVPPEEHGRRCAGTIESGHLDGGNEFTDSLVSLAEAGARQNGYNPDAYTTVLIQYQNASVNCFGGAHLGRRILATGLSNIKHELGHYEGLGHASVLRCYDQGHRPVALSGDCERSEYGDRYSTMGGTRRAFGAIHANRLGWLSGRFFDLAAGDFTRAYFLRPFTGSVRSERALRLRDGGSTYWLEYRTPVGVDNPAFHEREEFEQNGLLVHRQPAPGISQLLDMTPGSREQDNGRQDSWDAPLAAGRSWAVPGGEMRITVNSAGTEGVIVTLASRRVTVPDVRGLEVERAYAILRNAGFDPAPWYPVIDPTCSYIGTIAQQEPFPGTRWLPEQPIRLGVGEHPPFPCP